MNNPIQRLVMPNLVFGAPEDMYIRRHNEKAHVSLLEEKISFESGGIVSFDTFFNSITIGTWKKHAEIEDLTLQIMGTGRFVVRLGLHRAGHAHRWISEQIVNLSEQQETFISVSAWKRLESGMLYVHLEALESGTITGGHFSTQTPCQSSIKLGIVITHFNRKQWVLPAIERIRKELLSDPLYRDHIELVVVDNSKNITTDEATGATLLPNENYGGSGGFTRGLIYLKDRNTFTHCLFMDDDASCEIESIRRAFNLLAYAKSKDLAVSGALLREVEPARLHEKGGRFKNGQWWPLKSGLNMSSVGDLIESERTDVAPNYGAWWFFAFSIQRVQGYAFPFFVRGDDIQFGIQNRFNVITMNGIACWGEDFWYKESPLTRYLGTRASVIIALVFSDMSRFAAMKTLFGWSGASLLSHNYSSARAVNIAIKHVLSGPRFFADNIDTGSIRSEIAEKCPDEKLRSLELGSIPHTHRTAAETKTRKLLRLACLNGLLLPNALLKDETVFQHKSFRASFREIFRFKKVLYFYTPTDQGYIATLNKKQFFLALAETIRLATIFFISFARIREQYRSAWPHMTSESFWREIYQTKGLKQ